MFSRRLVATAVAATMVYLAPSFTPVPTFLMPQPAHAGVAPCGVVSSITFGSAFAIPAPVPCPSAGTHGPSPWGVIAFVAGVATLMFNAAYVWRTECRELTLDEAMTASALPVLGMAINEARGPRSACPAPAH